jgi:hypothetical protein
MDDLEKIETVLLETFCAYGWLTEKIMIPVMWVTCWCPHVWCSS